MPKDISQDYKIILIIGFSISFFFMFFDIIMAISIIIVTLLMCITKKISTISIEEVQSQPKSNFKTLTQFENEKKYKNSQKNLITQIHLDRYKDYHPPINPQKDDNSIACGIKINSNRPSPINLEILPSSYAKTCSCSSYSSSKTYHCVNVEFQNNNKHVLLENVALFNIYTKNDNNLEIYYEKSKKKKELHGNETYHFVGLQSFLNEKKQDMTVLTHIKEDNYFQICWCVDGDNHNLIIKQKGFKDICINRVSEFFIYSIGNNRKVETIVYNGIVRQLPYIDFKELYLVVFQGRKRTTDEHVEKLVYLKGNVILHRISNINPCFSLQKKINSRGSIICQRYNDKRCSYKDISTLVLFENGNSIYASESSAKYETIYNFLWDNEAIKKYNLDVNIIDEDGYVNIYYFKRECLAYYIINEFTNNADFKELMPNIFDDDINTINYHVKYKSSRLADIIFCYYILSNHRDCCFDNGLYGKNLKNDYIAGNAIYGIPSLDYFKGIEGDFSYINLTSQFYLEQEQINNFKEYVKVVYNNLGLEPNYNTFPISFTSQLIPADIFLNSLEKYLRQFEWTFNYASKNIYDKSQNVLLNFRDKKDEIIRKLIEKGEYKTKWKSEMELYQLILKYFKSAIYQYHSIELGHQSFDIFIPDLNIAIEYQGLQHYEPVELFGGIEGFNKRKALDKKKKQICKKNNIQLIEWKYTIPVNDINLRKIMAENNISI